MAVRRRGSQADHGGDAVPAALVVSHPLRTAIGFGRWAAYMAIGQAAFAWVAFAALSGSSLLGFIMLTRWLPGRAGRHARDGEQRFPGRAVMLHGLADVATIVSKP